MTTTRWNGEPCEARRITAIVTDDGRFPGYWAREHVGTRRNAVEVTYGGHTFYLDDEDGSGWAKVTSGGSPVHAHRSLTVDPGSIRPRLLGDGPLPPTPAEATQPDLTAEEAHALADELSTDLYWAQDRLAFVGECCDIADREQHTITTADVREWLKGARCGRQLAADAATATQATELEKTARVFAALHRSAEEDVSRVIALYERWVKAGPPPLGTSLARWWDARLVELHDAILPTAAHAQTPDELRERAETDSLTTHPTTDQPKEQ